MPIIFNQERVNLTKDYIKKHYGKTVRSIQITPKIIVLHWTQKKTLRESFEAMKAPLLDVADRSDLSGRLNVSAHYLVDRDGTIYQLMPDNWMARHVIGLNYYAIGIENVGGENNQQDLTLAQVEANASLVCFLMKKFPTIRYLIGHKEYLTYKSSPLWLEKDPQYETDKQDPDDGFLKKVRGLIGELPATNNFLH